MSGLFKNGINYTGAIPTAEEVPFDKTKHNIGDNVQEAIDWTYTRAKSASSDLEDYELQTDRKFFEFGQRMGENEESVRELNSNLTEQGLINVFDGELEQGYYSPTDGSKVSDANFVRSANKMSCNSGDVITLKTSKTATSAMVLFFNNGSFVSNKEDVLYNTSTGTCIVPSGANQFVFHIYINGGVAPSGVKVRTYLNNEITALNESLADYDLDNKVGNVIQGNYDYTSGAFIANDKNVCNATPNVIKNGDYVKIKLSKVVPQLAIMLFNTSGTKVGGSFLNNASEIELKATSDGILKWYVYDSNGITPQTVGHIGVYINNAIDTLKSDLADNKLFVGSLNCTTAGQLALPSGMTISSWCTGMVVMARNASTGAILTTRWHPSGYFEVVSGTISVGQAANCQFVYR